MKRYSLLSIVLCFYSTVQAEPFQYGIKAADTGLTFYSLYHFKKALTIPGSPLKKVVSAALGLLTCGISIATTYTHPHAQEIIGKKILSSCVGAHLIACIRPSSSEFIYQTVPKKFAFLYGMTSLLYACKNIDGVINKNTYKNNIEFSA